MLTNQEGMYPVMVGICNVNAAQALHILCDAGGDLCRSEH